MSYRVPPAFVLSSTARTLRTGLCKLRRDGGFTMVEVTLALGIAVFSMLSIFALLPLGLENFRSAMDSTAMANIVQSKVSEAQLTRYKDLSKLAPETYYNEEGSAKDAAGAIIGKGSLQHRYTVMVSVIDGMSLPTANANRFVSTLNIQIYDARKNNGDITKDIANGVVIKTYSAHIADLGI